MTDPANDPVLSRVATRAAEQAHAGRSPAYRWMRQRYASLSSLLEKHRPPMRAIAEEMAAAGIVGGKGKPLTDRAVRGIWKRICRDVAAGAQRRVTNPKVPQGWAPVPVAILPDPAHAKPTPAPALAPVEPPTPGPALPRHPTPSQRPDDPAPVRTPEEIQAELDAVREQLRQDRAWLPGQKRAAPRV